MRVFSEEEKVEIWKEEFYERFHKKLEEARLNIYKTCSGLQTDMNNMEAMEKEDCLNTDGWHYWNRPEDHDTTPFNSQ